MIFPKQCVGCSREGSYICDKCRKDIQADGISLRYRGVVRKLIKEIKYRSTSDMISELVELWSQRVGNIPVDRGSIVTSVPMYKTKQRKRGYNQAELIARQLAKRWGCEYRELLARKRETKPMYGLAEQERSRNVKDAFELLDNESTHGQMIICVDDIMTTGATLLECVRVLKHGGARGVKSVVIAR